MRIVLGAKTRKAKQRIKQFGNEWVCLREEASVQCFPDSPAGMLIEPFNGTEAVRSGARRWIEMPIDKDFELLEVD